MKIILMALIAGLGATVAHGAAPKDKSAAMAKEIWENNCQLCHGGTGAPPPEAKKLGVADLSLPKWQASRTDDQIRKIIMDGKPDTLMQPFKDELAPDEIEALVKYVRKLGGKPTKKTN
jgi:mono/diheme cytochrome c family protein